MRPLGTKQEAILRHLRDHGRWFPGCGWMWGSYKQTGAILDTLVKRGIVTKEPHGKPCLGIQYYEYKPNAQEEGLARR